MSCVRIQVRRSPVTPGRAQDVPNAPAVIFTTTTFTAPLGVMPYADRSTGACWVGEVAVAREVGLTDQTGQVTSSHATPATRPFTASVTLALHVPFTPPAPVERQTSAATPLVPGRRRGRSSSAPIDNEEERACVGDEGEGGDRDTVVDPLNLCGLRTDKPSSADPAPVPADAAADRPMGLSCSASAASASGDLVDAVEGEFWANASSALLRMTVRDLLGLRVTALLTAAPACSPATPHVATLAGIAYSCASAPTRATVVQPTKLDLSIGDVAWCVHRASDQRDGGSGRADQTHLVVTTLPVDVDLMRPVDVSSDISLALKLRVWLSADAAAPRRCVAGPAAVLRHLQATMGPKAGAAWSSRDHAVAHADGATLEAGCSAEAAASADVVPSVAASVFAPILAPVCGRAGRRLLRCLGALGLLQLTVDPTMGFPCRS